MKTQRISLFTLAGLMALLAVGAPAFADCNADRQQAMSIVQNIKASAGNNAKVQSMSAQLAQLMDRMSSQGCDSQILQVYQTMQREGIQAN